MTATAAPSPVTPVDISGPFMEAELTGLAPASQYHYRIGRAGTTTPSRPRPTGDFTWDDIGDTGQHLLRRRRRRPTCNKTWMSCVWSQFARREPRLRDARRRHLLRQRLRQPGVHQLFQDISPVATTAGDVLLGQPRVRTSDAASAPGTPQRLAWPTTRAASTRRTRRRRRTTRQPGLAHPGCPAPAWAATAARARTGAGSRWAHVLFISEPEPWPGRLTGDWQAKAGALMAAAEAIPAITLIVTYGHRPATRARQRLAGDGRRSTTSATVTARRPPRRQVRARHRPPRARRRIFAPQHGVVPDRRRRRRRR